MNNLMPINLTTQVKWIQSTKVHTKIDNSSIPISIKETIIILKSFERENSRPENFIDIFYQTFETKILPLPHNGIQNSNKEGTQQLILRHQYYFYIKPDKNIMTKENYKSTSEINTHTKPTAKYWQTDYGSISSVQFISVAHSCPTLCDPMNLSTPALPVYHQLREFTQTHVH